MADLERRGGYTPRRVREQRAYTLVMVGGAAGLLGVAGLVVAMVSSFGAGIPILLLIVAAVCFFIFRRTVS